MHKKIFSLLLGTAAIGSWFLRETIKTLVLDGVLNMMKPTDPTISLLAEFGPPTLFAILSFYLLLPLSAQPRTRRHMLSIGLMVGGAVLLFGGVMLFRSENGHFPFFPRASNVDAEPINSAEGGRGGNALVSGNRSSAIGGPAGESGIVPGGRGGDATVHGDNSFAIGGQGGGAPQADGRGGRGGIAGLGIGYNTILPDGHRLSDYGRGGDGGHTQRYLETHWPALTIDEMVTAFGILRISPPAKIRIVCANESCIDLAESLVDLFGRLKWPEPSIESNGQTAPGLIKIAPHNAISENIVNAISMATKGKLVISKTQSSKKESAISISIGSK